MPATIKEGPILFSPPMVRAILDGRKTKTRRVMKPQPSGEVPGEHLVFTAWNEEVSTHDARDPNPSVIDEWTCPYGYKGHRLWVRERWATAPTVSGDDEIVYAADYQDGSDRAAGIKYRPSIHMPRRACRLVLEIVSVCVEQLQEITATEVVAEGFPFSSDLDQFKATWNNLNGPRGFGWETNPWVWVVEFKVVES